MTPCPRCATPLDRLPSRCPVCGDPGRAADPAARRLVAAYLAGATMAEGELRAAWGDARDDADFAAHLRDELGLDLDDTPCASFRDGAAAFAELPPAARDREVPDLAEHARDCPTCRRLLWQLRPLWDVDGVLAEPIRVAVGAGVRDRGLGPPAEAVAFAALRAGPDDANPVPLEWRLDPVRVRVSPGPRVAVWADEPGSAEFASADGASYFAGALDDLPPDGLPLPPGRWACEVRLAGGAYRFELDLTAGDA